MRSAEEVRAAIDGAARFGSGSAFGDANGEDAPGASSANGLAPYFIQDLDAARLPRRRWLLEGTYLAGKVTVVVAPPGAGKSTLEIQQGVALITGRPITGHQVYERTKVWIYNNEDDLDEQKRRLAAVLQHWDIPFAEIQGRLALNSGEDRPLLVASTDDRGNVIQTPDVDACIKHIKAHEFGAFLVDPFAETHDGDENSNKQIRKVAAMFREIARQCKCAVELVHHTRKLPQGSSDGFAGNADAGRGASALIGVARAYLTLFSMSPRDAERYGVPEAQRRLYVRLDDAKSNFTLIGAEACWFKRTGVTIANGDEVGVLVPVDLQADHRAAERKVELHRSIIAAMLAQVPEPEITLNAAANRLAYSGHTEFVRYRQTDKQGRRRVSQTLRDAIKAACQSGIVIVSGGCSSGFIYDSEASPAALRRVEIHAEEA